MRRTSPLALSALPLLVAGLIATGSPVLAQTQPAATPATAKSTKAVPAKKPVSASRKALKSEAKGLALATEVTETISDNQLQISSRVLTGTAHCEFNQTVTVTPVQDKPGHFAVAFNKASYLMTPQETSTGAVRLEDKRSGVVWLQIPVKSMMMNQKIGQRMVDGCTLAEQRAAVAAVDAAAR